MTTKHTATVKDLYNAKQRYHTTPHAIDDFHPLDQPIITAYLKDMELGRNVGGKKGERTYLRIYTLRCRLRLLARVIQEHFPTKRLTTLTDLELHDLFKRMRDGKITKSDGKPYVSVIDYVKAYKSFYHWLQRHERRNGNHLQDITVDLDTTKHKPRFNYLTPENVQLLADNARGDYRALILLLFDGGVRPGELLNLRVNDLTMTKEAHYECNIREETSKTFGRRIKLLLCSAVIKSYIAQHQLQPTDYVWRTSQKKTNLYLKRLGQRVLNIPDLGMYDFRHASACYWMMRYKSESALKYRFGWKKSEMIHYYTELLGMKDTITQDDLVDTEQRSRLEADLKRQEQQVALLSEQLAAQEESLRRLQEAISTGVVQRAIAEVESLRKKK
jgi:integrase